MIDKESCRGDNIVQQGMEGDELFVIDSGECNIIKDGEQVGTLGVGSVFGELVRPNVLFC